MRLIWKVTGRRRERPVGLSVQSPTGSRFMAGITEDWDWYAVEDAAIIKRAIASAMAYERDQLDDVTARLAKLMALKRMVESGGHQFLAKEASAEDLAAMIYDTFLGINTFTEDTPL